MTDPGVVFTAVAEVHSGTRIARTAASLALRYAATRSEELERANGLANTLYLRGEVEHAVAVCALVAENEFTGNHIFWTQIQAAALLAWWLRRAEPDAEARRTAIAERIRATATFGTNEGLHRTTAKVMARRVRGEHLSTDKLAEALAGDDPATRTTYRLIVLSQLLYIAALGGSPEYPAERAWAEAVELDAALTAG